MQCNANKRLIFVHIPKCAGTSMLHVFWDYYGKESVHYGQILNHSNFAEGIKENQEQWRSNRVFFGHYPYGFAEFLPGESIYGTFLRDPREREISSYNYVKLNSHHPQHSVVASGEMDLMEYLRASQDNIMCRWLYRYDLLNFKGLSDRTAKDVYEVAVDVLNNMSFVGISTEFDKSLKLIGRVCGWSREPDVKRLNTTSPSPCYDELPSHIQDVIDEKTEYDQKLYTQAKRIFNEQYAHYFE